MVLKREKNIASQPRVSHDFSFAFPVQDYGGQTRGKRGHVEEANHLVTYRSSRGLLTEKATVP